VTFTTVSISVTIAPSRIQIPTGGSPMASVLDEVWTMDQVVEAVGVTRQTIYNYLKAGRFPAPTLLGGLVCVWERRTGPGAIRGTSTAHVWSGTTGSWTA
jgi:predicted DNA-binding transcriptional regulator AlpA